MRTALLGLALALAVGVLVSSACDDTESVPRQSSTSHTVSSSSYSPCDRDFGCMCDPCACDPCFCDPESPECPGEGGWGGLGGFGGLGGIGGQGGASPMGGAGG